MYVTWFDRIALGPRAGQKVLSLQTVSTQALPPTPVPCVNEQGFSLHAEVCCAAHHRKKFESGVTPVPWTVYGLGFKPGIAAVGCVLGISSSRS